MVLKLFNTLTGKIEEFIPLSDNEVKIYTCGPTVYDYAHIGNFRTYVWQDLLKRWLLYRGYRVKHVMNITDVDDKTIAGAQREKVSLREYTKRYLEAFFEDLRTLNILPADVYPRATDHIPEIVTLVKKLLEKGLAYKSEDGSVYFSISKFKDYGKLSKIDLSKLKPGARVRVDSYSKENICDFALWKAWTPEDGDVYWETEIGKGRPGWHIECSAMSMKYLGETFDIHSGGRDLIFPHHENEIAQSEGATGKLFVKYWLHGEHLIVEGKKMSKSLGNYYTLRDLLNMGYDPMAIRFLLLSTHYRSQLNFTIGALKSAEKTVESLMDFMRKLRDLRDTPGEKENIQPLIGNFLSNFEKAMDSDLNISEALSHLFSFIGKINEFMLKNKLTKSDADKILKVMLKIDQVLGLRLGDVLKEKLPNEAERLLEEREKLRAKKEYKKADEIRELLLRKYNILIEDMPYGPTWKFKKKSE